MGLVAAVCAFSYSTQNAGVPILCYHRISNGKPGNTTVTPEHFKSQMQALHDNGYQVIPLAQLVAWKSGKGPVPAAHSIVVTFDDGHESFYTDAVPIIDEMKVPVTQFLVANCISNGSYCVTWEQVETLARDPLIDLESHTWSHPTFRKEALRRTEAGYTRFVDHELTESKTTFEKRLNKSVPLLAWPYGWNSPMLLKHASLDGYQAAFSVECRSVTEADSEMAMPRCMVLDAYVGADFLKFLSLADRAATTTPVNHKWRVMPIVPTTDKKTE